MGHGVYDVSREKGGCTGREDGRKVGKKWGVGPSAVKELLKLEY